MRIETGLDGLRQLPPGAVLSIGNFDGIHLGHAALLDRARALRAARAGSCLAVATFEPHPFSVLRPQHVPPRLTPPDIKRSLLDSLGVDRLIVLPPEPGVLNLSAEDFFAILRDQARPAALVEGADFTFGKDRGGTIERLRQWMSGTAMALEVVPAVRVPLLDCRVVPVSSSLVRWLLGLGRVRDAAIALGRAYALRGEVVRGYRRGQAIGTPTANLQVDEQLVPGDGVYAGRCAVDGCTYAVALSIGSMPTFGENLRRQVEAHLIDFAGDLYGRKLQVDMTDWLRPQRKFASVDQLRQQMIRDVSAARRRAQLDPARAVAMI